MPKISVREIVIKKRTFTSNNSISLDLFLVFDEMLKMDELFTCLKHNQICRHHLSPPLLCKKDICTTFSTLCADDINITWAFQSYNHYIRFLLLDLKNMKLKPWPLNGVPYICVYMPTFCKIVYLYAIFLTWCRDKIPIWLLNELQICQLANSLLANASSCRVL